MNERLEELKEKYMSHEYDYNLDKKDIEHLIQQAEKVQELEKTCTEYHHSGKYLLQQKEELEEEIKRLKVWYNSYWKESKRNNELAKENQRYKEVLERIKKSYPVGNDEFVPVEVIYEIQMIIDKALKGETNETSK